MIVYKVTNKINGKEYVGQTINDLKQRKRSHISKALNKEDTFYFHCALRKYGPENFSWEIMAEGVAPLETLNELEKHFIRLYNTFEKGYNLTLGGSAIVGFKHSGETKRRMSEIAKGRKHSEKTKKRLSEINKGKKLSEETRRRISESRKGRFVGRNSSVAKAVIINNKHFDTVSGAAKAKNVTRLTIYRRIRRGTVGYQYA